MKAEVIRNFVARPPNWMPSARHRSPGRKPARAAAGRGRRRRIARPMTGSPPCRSPGGPGRAGGQVRVRDRRGAPTRGPRSVAAACGGSSRPNSSPSCNTSWRHCGGASPALRTRCWRSWSAAKSCRVSRQASWRTSTSCNQTDRSPAGARGAQTEIDQLRHQSVSRRDELVSELDADLVALYERQRAGGGAGAGLLQGRRAAPAGSRSTAAGSRASPRRPRTR